MACVYAYKQKAIILVYVDNLPIFAETREILKEVIKFIERIYEVRHLGQVKTLLRIDFKSESDGQIRNINCAKYIGKCMKKIYLVHKTNISLPSPPGYIPSSSTLTYEEVAESPVKDRLYRTPLLCLQYITNGCRPVVAYNVAVISQFSERPGQEHWKGLVQILLYLSSTKSLGLRLIPECLSLQLTAYDDASRTSDPADS